VNLAPRSKFRYEGVFWLLAPQRNVAKSVARKANHAEIHASKNPIHVEKGRDVLVSRSDKNR